MPEDPYAKARIDPNDKRLKLRLGNAASISSPGNSPGDKLRSLYRQHVPEEIQGAVENLVKLGEITGLSSPSSYGGAATANIPALLKTGKGSPELRMLMEYAAKRYPRLSKLAKTASFIDEPAKVGSDMATGTYGTHYWLNKSTGVPVRYEDEIEVALNSLEGSPRSLQDVIESIGHEMTHAYDTAKGMKWHPKEWLDFKKADALKPYYERILEGRAYQGGKTAFNTMRKRFPKLFEKMVE